MFYHEKNRSYFQLSCGPDSPFLVGRASAVWPIERRGAVKARHGLQAGPPSSSFSLSLYVAYRPALGARGGPPNTGQQTDAIQSWGHPLVSVGHMLSSTDDEPPAAKSPRLAPSRRPHFFIVPYYGSRWSTLKLADDLDKESWNRRWRTRLTYL